jgi:hypothetical protein
MSKRIDLTGNRYGRLTVLHYVEKKSFRPRWLCKCDCGNIKETYGFSLKSGDTQSCGCLAIERTKEVNTIHGDSTNKGIHPLYRVWSNMLSRCSNPKVEFYANYGGRGIVVCKEWLNYVPFKEWAMSNGYNSGLEIDRINNNSNYSPENCRWVTGSINSRNRRSKEGSTSKYIGVGFDKYKNKWKASLKLFGKTKHIGNYLTELEAALARDNYVKNNNLEGFTINFQ